jgi:hypothetical protein
MDLTDSGLNRKVFFKKGEAQMFLVKYARPLSFDRPLTLLRQLVQLQAIRNLIANRAEKIRCAVGIGKTWCVGTGRNSATGILAHFPIAFIVAFPIENKNILDKIVTAPLEIFSHLVLSAVANNCEKNGADRAISACGN